jgi:hypothetical protein
LSFLFSLIVCLNADPEPQLIAEAIAAFYQNNLRRKLAGRPMMKSQTFPGITMVGVVPIFYRIPITAELVQCVQAGPEPTIVQRCIPSVPDRDAYPGEGLVPLANRRTYCYAVF